MKLHHLLMGRRLGSQQRLHGRRYIHVYRWYIDTYDILGHPRTVRGKSISHFTTNLTLIHTCKDSHIHVYICTFVKVCAKFLTCDRACLSGSRGIWGTGFYRQRRTPPEHSAAEGSDVCGSLSPPSMATSHSYVYGRKEREREMIIDTSRH